MGWAPLTVLTCLACAPAASATSDQFIWSGPAQVGRGPLMHGVSCPSASQCTAVQDNGNEVTFNTASFAVLSTATIDPGNDLTAVSCPSSSRCVAVGRTGADVTFDPIHPAHRDVRTVDPGHGLNDISCALSNRYFTTCVTVDNAGNMVSFGYDPSAFSAIQEEATQAVDPGQSLPAVACPAGGSRCTAVDGAGNEVTFRVDGTGTPSVFSLDSSAALSDIACPSTSQCTAVGSIPPTPQQVELSGYATGTRITFNPSSPGSATTAHLNSVGLAAVSCPSAADCTAVGIPGGLPGMIEDTFDPRSTSDSGPRPLPAGGASPDVTCTSVDECVVIDLRGTAFRGLPVDASTHHATGVGKHGATLRGLIRSTATRAAWRFQYGASTRYNRATLIRNAGAGTTHVARALRNLRRGVLYHYRLVVTTTGPDGVPVTSYGADHAFRTHGSSVHRGPCSSAGLRFSYTSGGVTFADHVDRLRSNRAGCGTARHIAATVAKLLLHHQPVPATISGFRVRVASPCSTCTPVWRITATAGARKVTFRVR